VPRDMAEGFKIIGRHADFYGVCADCADEASQAA
jgi:Fe2+ or Zn2+ uptake regulation protein